MSFSQIYIGIIEKFMPNRLVPDIRRSDINFLTFSSKDNSETKGYVCIVLTGEFSLVNISVTHILILVAS